MKSKVKKGNPRNAVLNRHLSADVNAYFLPSQEQHDFCMTNYDCFRDPVILNAANIVMVGYLCQEKVHHTFIRVINALIGRFGNY